MLKPTPTIRPPTAAGLFYPADAVQLRQEIDHLFGQVQTEPVAGQIVGLLAPHAGYVYSGKVAAAAYKHLLADSYDNVIVIAPSHYDEFEGCSVFLGDYQTPLGLIPTRRQLAQAIAAQSPSIMTSSAGHQQEHALEVQLPFLQVAVPSFQLVPIVLCWQDYAIAQRLSAAIVAALRQPEFASQRTLLVSSSDLSHYYPVERAQKLDQVVMDDIAAFDPDQLWRDIQTRRGQACGFATILTTLLTAQQLGATQARILAYATSATVSQDRDRVVGYTSALLY